MYTAASASVYALLLVCTARHHNSSLITTSILADFANGNNGTFRKKQGRKVTGNFSGRQLAKSYGVWFLTTALTVSSLISSSPKTVRTVAATEECSGVAYLR